MRSRFAGRVGFLLRCAFVLLFDVAVLPASIDGSYQNALRMFCSYIADPDYGWDRVCEQRFGTHPAQVFFEWNTATHVQDHEQSPEKRPFRKQELQDFFDHAHDQVRF